MRQKKKLELEFPSGCSVTLSNAYQGQANGYTAMALASRCESRFHRMYLSSYKVLRELQAARAKQSTPPAVPEPTQPEPPPPVAAEVKTQPASPPSARQPEEQICGNEPGPHPKSEIPTSEILFTGRLARFEARQNPKSDIRHPKSQLALLAQKTEPILLPYLFRTGYRSRNVLESHHSRQSFPMRKSDG